MTCKVFNKRGTCSWQKDNKVCHSNKFSANPSTLQQVYAAVKRKETTYSVTSVDKIDQIIESLYIFFLRYLPNLCRSKWSRGLRRRSAAVRLLRLWVRIPPVAWMSVCCECCVCCQVEVSTTSWSLVQRSPAVCGASLCVI
jgi:hypothetical protein